MSTAGKKLNVLLLLALIAYSTVYFLEIIRFPHFEQRITIVILYVAFLLFSTIEIVTSLIAVLNNKRNGDDTEDKIFVKGYKDLLCNKKMLLIILLVGYAILIPRLGFFTTSFVFLVLTLYILGTRNYYLVFGLPVGLVLFFYYCFVMLLRVRIPTGMFF